MTAAIAPISASTRSLIHRYLRPHVRRLAVLASLLLVGVGVQLLVPQLLRRFIDDAQAAAPMSSLLRLALLFLAVALLGRVADAAATYMGQDLRWRATNSLRSDLVRHTLRLDMGFHHLQTPGKMIERIDGDVTALSHLMSDYAMRVLGNVLLVVGVLVLLAREDLRVGAVFAVFVLLTVIALRRIFAFAVPQWRVAREAAAELFGFLEERLAGTEDIRAAGARPWIMQRFHDLMRKTMQVERRAYLLGSTSWIATVSLFTMGNILALAMGAWLYRAGQITIGTVYLIFHYTEILRRPVEQLIDQLEDFQRAAGGLERVAALLGQPASIDVRAMGAPAVSPSEGHLPRSGPGPLAPGALAVEMVNVSFGYEPDKPVLQEVSLHLPAGRVLGLLGRTGSGKSTLARLLFRLYDADGGSIRLGGHELDTLPLGTLRRRVGLVTQDVQLFNASLRDNLTFFDASLSDERVLDVLTQLGMGTWVTALPAGLDTELSAGGDGLSAGEAQLLAFTRVFLRDPGLVILDEASSRLDPATEELIERAVDRLMAERTGIVIAHRLATVERADQILILEEGRVREHGDRLALVADPTSRFRELLATGLEEVLA